MNKIKPKTWINGYYTTKINKEGKKERIWISGYYKEIETLQK